CNDCNDNNPNMYPGNGEACDGIDNDCNGVADAPGGELDVDNDGSLSCNDCNDNDPANYPGNMEICDGQDNDCNGVADFPGGELDADNDGSLSCFDCNDSDPNNFPGNLEICDGQDNDCNGMANFPGETVDQDNDGVLACNDCDDNDPNNFPGNTEQCDGFDNNCDGVPNFPGEQSDADNDGALACVDCNDGDPNNFPGNTESCDGQDNNCNGFVDQAEVPVSVMCGSVPNAIEECNGAMGCGIQSCLGDYYDVDGMFGTGCECLAAPAPITTGNSCASAISVGSLTDANQDSVNVSGNVPVAGREVWYVFNAIDDLDTNGDEFHVDGRFLVNPGGGYAIDVYRGGCPGTGTQLANGETSSFDWFTDFNQTSAGCDGPAPCGEGNCTTTPVPGANVCNDDTATFHVRVYRPSNTASCGAYQMQFSNGVY
ncbi:MAG TPA: hypothetical protein ENK57_08990, partial [Polyangiaceae bacterium]|nr:hypothetical protein [Polyangiaceae bacterium]